MRSRLPALLLLVLDVLGLTIVIPARVLFRAFADRCSRRW
jgi:hypothetical protein